MKWVRTQFRRLLLAFQIMSRIPINVRLPCEAADTLCSMVYFPLVGAAIGGLMSLMAWLGYLLTDSYIAAAALAVFTDVLVTGGIHMDGLCDTCDGFFSGRDRARILEIMHDSRMGTFGGLGMSIMLMLQFAFIAAALERLGCAALALTFAAPVLSRMCVVLLEKIGVSARKGMGSAYVVGMSWQYVGGAFAIGMAVLLMVKPVALLGIPLAAGLAFLFNAYFTRKIGGLTGDTLGAANELSALLFYMLAALKFIV